MKIKTITQRTTVKESDTVYTNAYSEYDENGNETLAVDYDFDGAETSKTVTKYNDRNQRTEMQIFCGEDEPNETHFYEYTPEGRIAKETIEYQGGFKSIKTYDHTPNNLTITTVDEEGNVEEKEEFTTDADGNVTEHLITDYNGDISLHQVSQFENGKVIIAKNLDKDGRETDHRIYKYQDDGKLSFMGILNPKKELLDSYAYQYDEKGRETLQTIGSRGKITTEYDDEARTVTSTTSTGTGRIVNQTITTSNEDGATIREEDFNTIREFEYTLYI